MVVRLHSSGVREERESSNSRSGNGDFVHMWESEGVGRKSKTEKGLGRERYCPSLERTRRKQKVGGGANLDR